MPTWANVKTGAIVRVGEVWATVLAVHPNVHDRAETGIDLWIGQGRSGKIVSIEVRPGDQVPTLG